LQRGQQDTAQRIDRRLVARGRLRGLELGDQVLLGAVHRHVERAAGDVERAQRHRRGAGLQRRQHHGAQGLRRSGRFALGPVVAPGQPIQPFGRQHQHPAMRLDRTGHADRLEIAARQVERIDAAASSAWVGVR